MDFGENGLWWGRVSVFLSQASGNPDQKSQMQAQET